MEIGAYTSHYEDQHVSLLGSFLGLKLEVDERVIDRVPARSEAWQAVRNPRMLILARYRMGASDVAVGLLPAGAAS